MARKNQSSHSEAGSAAANETPDFVSQLEPSMNNWQALLDFISDKDEHPQVLLTVQFFLLGSASGQAYLERVRRFNPNLGANRPLDLVEMVMTYECLEELVAEPRFGVDPGYFVWSELWSNASAGPSPKYKLMIRLCREMEAQAENDGARARLRDVREAVERELQGEEYLERKFQAKGKAS